jgi:histidinol-phosphate/aromatic aminotransferase/cobyric acid decarboxylase-like protein
MAEHGGMRHDELASHGLSPADVLDLSVNVNPYGPCDRVRQAVAEAAIDRYPDPSATPARRALAGRFGVDEGRVVVGNGAVDLLWALARCVLREGDRVVIVEPAFSEMRSAAELVGAEVIAHTTQADRDFRLDLDALDAHVRAARPRMLYVCTPSNPAGVCTPQADIARLARRHPDTLFVVDASFLSMSARHREAEEVPSGVVWLRSLTKDHALAGVRVGFAVTDLAPRIERGRPPWSVNAIAQAAAVAATSDVAARFVDESRARLFADRARLAGALASLGLRVHPSETIYVLVDLGHRRATELRARLLARHGVLVRDATSFGLPHHARIAARPDIDRFLTALREELRS